MSDGTPNTETPSAGHDWEALARYLAGESPAEEAEAIRRRLAAHPADAELVAALDQAVGRLAYRAPADLDVAGALGRVHARMDEPQVRSLPRRPPGRAARPPAR